MSIFCVLCLVKYSQEITLNINDFLSLEHNGWKKCFGASQSSNFLNIRKIIAIMVPICFSVIFVLIFK